MSKYTKLEDAINLFGRSGEYHADMIADMLSDLSTIEVSEDCISREWLRDMFGLSEKTRKWGGDHSGYNTMMLYEIQDYIEDAPSVVPTAYKLSAVGECISKAYLEQEIKNQTITLINDEYWRGWNNALGKVVELIENAPSEAPSRAEGEWLPIIAANEVGEPCQVGIYCSECGEHLGCEANYCPNCGAKMKG